MRSINEIRAELRKAEALQELAATLVLEATPVIWKYTLTTDGTRTFNRVYDDTCKVYNLFGKVMNRQEAESAGHTYLTDGGMDYVFSTLSNKLIMAVGGGTIYVGKSIYDKNDDSHVIAMNELSVFLVANPEGGDVTEIIKRHQARRQT